MPPSAAHAADRRLVPADLVFTLADGARLPARLWPAVGGRPQAVILALHGFNDSRDAWELSAPVLASRGISLYAPDQRGFGQAPLRGRWAGTDRMVSDAAELARLVAAREPGVPLYLMGESMGGAVLLCLAASPEAPPVAGYILLAPAVWSRDQMDPVMTASLWAAATLAPDWELTGHELPLHITASDNLAALYRLGYDPLTVRTTRASTLQGLVQLMSRAQQAAAHVHARMLVTYGGRDQLVPARSTAATWALLPSDVRRSFYPSGYHLLMRDLNRSAVIGDVASWILTPDQALPSGGDIAAAGWVAGQGWDDTVPLWLPGNLDGLVAPDPR
ncbi:alpha/beta fold hydrolase [Lichenicola sp.]|uniref:alpha/beta fold hydrolase n=1 Tax=Lichenicola sp. TaxID=2804529 RepID=UPI003AFF94B2